MQLSVQGYLQQRKRLNPEIFPYLNCKYLMDFYRSDEPRLWKGYLLIAIDGSKAKVPNSKDNREAFGNSGNQHSGKGQVRALVSGMYDVLNHFYLDIEIEHTCISENELAKRNLKQLKKIGIRKPVVAVFDRGYPSLEFIDFLETRHKNHPFYHPPLDLNFGKKMTILKPFPHWEAASRRRFRSSAIFLTR